MEGLFWFFILLVMVAADAAVAYAANERGRDPVAWFMLALVVSPILAILILLALPEPATPQAPLRTEPEWKPTTTNWSIENRPTPHESKWNLDEIRGLGETTKRPDNMFERMYGKDMEQVSVLKARVAELEEQLRKLTNPPKPEPEPALDVELEANPLVPRKPVLDGYWHEKGGTA
jgi:hypothetical protein